MTMPFARVQARRERAEREGWYREPPLGFLDDAGLTMSAWLDALYENRAESLVDTWMRSQQTLTPEARRVRAERNRYDLFG